MLHENISVAEIVDSECAHEFLLEATRLATSAELEDTGWRLGQKCERFQQLLGPEALPELDEAAVTELLGLVFFMRRKAPAILRQKGLQTLRAEIAELLHGRGPVGARLEQFAGGFEGLPQQVAVGLASELLHYSNPERYWLWTSWIWEPKTSAGALPLVLQKEVELGAKSPRESYEKVGRAISMVRAAGHAEGFTRVAREPFGTDLFLACVYAVYMYTVFKMRLSAEFNRILPGLPEFTRRLLGVNRIN